LNSLQDGTAWTVPFKALETSRSERSMPQRIRSIVLGGANHYIFNVTFSEHVHDILREQSLLSFAS